MATTTFHVADIVVFVLTVVISLGIGIYYAVSGDRQKTTSEYLVGGRAMGFLPVSISLLASFESSIMMLGSPAEGYFFGTQILIGILGNSFVALMAAYTVVPLMHSLKITSSFEYFDLRFKSTIVRRLGSALGMLNALWYNGIVLFGPAVALEGVTGFPLWISIIAISIVSVIYTSIGGLKAVIWTDVFQFGVMFMGIMAVIVQGTKEVGGAKKVWDTAMEGGRLELFNFDFDPMVRHTFWSLTLGNLFGKFWFVFNQGTVQRISSTRTIKDAKRVIYIVVPISGIMISLTTFEGVVAYSYYQIKGCDPMENKEIGNKNQLLPHFVMDLFQDIPGMPGLFLASLFSASLSTLSTGLSGLSAMAWCDAIRPLMGDKATETKGAIIAKFVVVLCGATSCGIAFLVAMLGGTLIQISFSLLSSFGIPSAGMFFLGCFCPRATAKGAFIGGVAGVLMSSWISFGMNFSPDKRPYPILHAASTDNCVVANETMSTTLPQTTTIAYNNSQSTDGPLEGLAVLYNVSYQLIPVIGLTTTVLTGYIVSLITGPNKPGDVDPRYLLQVSTSLTYCLPSRLQTWMSSFGTQFHQTQYKDNKPSPGPHKMVIVPDTEDDNKILSHSKYVYDNQSMEIAGDGDTTETGTKSGGIHNAQPDTKL